MKQILLVLPLFGLILAADPFAVEKIGPPLLLIESETYFMDPLWSPDGSQIAITGSGYVGIHIYSFEGNEIKTLTTSSAAGFGMSWSHASDYIARRISKYENKRRFSTIAVYDVTSGEEKLAADYVNRLPGKPVWSRNDDLIFMNSSRARTFKVPGKNYDSSNRSQEIIYYNSENKIVRRALSAGPASVLVSAERTILDSKVSPDGQKIVYQVFGGNLWVVDIESEDVIDLGPGENPSWSADSEHLAYMITEDDGHQITQSDIYVINIDGQGKVNLNNSPGKFEMHPDWSPNGKWIAYDTNEDGKIWMQEVK